VPLLTPFVPLLVALVWPVTVLIILLWFKDGLRELITNIAEAKVGDSLYFKFWQATGDVKSVGTAALQDVIVPPQLRAPEGAEMGQGYRCFLAWP
jgi:hypothetical protein